MPVIFFGYRLTVMPGYRLFLPATVWIFAAAASAGELVEGLLDYRIGPQALDKALVEYSLKTGLQVVADGTLTAGIQSPGVSGRYTTGQAIQKLLTGTGTAVRSNRNNTIQLEKSAEAGRTESPGTTTLPAVNVTGVADIGDQQDGYVSSNSASSATRTDVPLIETPVSVQTVTRQVIQDQLAASLEDSLRNISGIQTSTSGGFANNFVVRGFDVRNFYRDGFRFPTNDFPSAAPRPIGDLERIDVIKGPASFLYGQAEVGGFINLVPKQPLNERHYALEQQFGSFDRFRTLLDATGPVTDDDTLLYRINFESNKRNSFIDFNGLEQTTVTPVVAWKINPKTQLKLELQHTEGSTTTSTAVPLLPGANRPLDLPRNFSKGESFDGAKFSQNTVSATLSHEFNQNWTFRARGVVDLAKNSQVFTLGPPFLVGVNANGRLLQGRRLSGQIASTDTYTGGVDLNGKFTTGLIEHNALIGANYYTTNTSDLFQGGPFTALDIFNPVHGTAFPGFSSASLYTQRNDYYGIYLQDQAKLPYDLYLLSGVRYDNIEVNLNNFGTNQNNSEGILSPKVGLLWQAKSYLSLYGSYNESVGNVLAFPSVADTDLLKAERGQQWEAGIKTELFDGRFISTLAVFELNRQNTPTLDINDPSQTLTVPIGAARSRGIELDITGEILPGWNIIANYALTDTRITRSNDGFVGNQLFNVPRNSGSIFTTYEFLGHRYLKGLKVGGGVILRDQRQGDLANSFQLPGYGIVSLLAAYKVAETHNAKVTVQFNVENLTDTQYFSESITFRGGAVYGAPRTFLGSVRVEY